MDGLFRDFATIDYPIIDADSHVNEPADLWQQSVPESLKARAPRVESSDKGDIWVFNDGKETWPLGLTAVAGLSYFDYRVTGLTYDTIRPGSFDTEARLKDMDADGIHAQVIYPSITLKGASIYGDDRELQLACVQAYNDWLFSFCEGSAGRLIPQAIIPTTGIEDACQTLEAAMKKGHRGVVISAFPNGSLEPLEEDERFWALAEEGRVPIAVHIGGFVSQDLTKRRKMTWTSLAFVGMAALTKAGGQTLPAVCDILFSGIFEKHPGLEIVLVEANIGWIPGLLEQSDDMFMRYRWYTNAVEEQTPMPSEIFHRNFWATFMIDTVGMDLLHRMNVGHLMWSTDYPHSGSDWPNSRITIERVFRDVPNEDVKLMLHTNCKEIYGLDHIPETLGNKS